MCFNPPFKIFVYYTKTARGFGIGGGRGALRRTRFLRNNLNGFWKTAVPIRGGEAAFQPRTNPPTAATSNSSKGH